MKIIHLLAVLSGLNCGLGHAWKPIVGQLPAATSTISGSKATSATFTSSFSLQQSHPEYGRKTAYVTDIGNAGKELLIKEIPQQAPTEEIIPINNHYKSYESALLPAAINFGDAKFGYKTAGALSFKEDQCSVKKYAFNHDGVVHYESEIPELSQFTICFWMRFTNHSGDHVILTYSAEEGHRDFQFWVANAKNSSFISMAIKGQQIYRLNYPLRVRQWHHTCTSWNGKTGEWQVWLKAERIGRGFHNSLVGHKIPPKGKLFSGGPSVTGKISEGLHFEVTLVQIYRVALSAGKAHRDHKHHHAHHFDHEGKEIHPTTKPPPVINRPQPMHTLLANGQIPTRVRINLAQPAPTPSEDISTNAAAAEQALTIHTNFINGQINAGSRLVAQQLVGLNQPLGPHATQTVNRQTVLDPNNPTKIKFVDETETRILFKRDTKDTEKNLKKRGLVFLDDGSIVDDPLIQGSAVLKYDGLAEFGGQQFKEELGDIINVEDKISEHDHEPAEEEVKAVMALCGTCDTEPFQGAIVFAWKDAHEHLNNALKGYSVGRCGNF
ncbi:pentraxin-related protein b6 [Haematobia irritans]|uniref:pentraxin-related protein b6 n=1 Tax=Haematobia irritans TaxID=7368 RepID=UPI003F4FD81A